MGQRTNKSASAAINVRFKSAYKLTCTFMDLLVEWPSRSTETDEFLEKRKNLKCKCFVSAGSSGLIHLQPVLLIVSFKSEMR